MLNNDYLYYKTSKTLQTQAIRVIYTALTEEYLVITIFFKNRTVKRKALHLPRAAVSERPELERFAISVVIYLTYVKHS